MIPVLSSRRKAGATVRETEKWLWRLEIPTGPAGVYRWAQLDDHLDRARKNFPWRPPLRFRLRARVSTPDLPGTWGFGLWNEPFTASLGIGGTGRRLPVLPNAAWFFFAGVPNHLAFRDTHPAQGFLAATFASPQLPSLLLAPGAVALPLLALPVTARLLRRLAGRLIREDAELVPGDATAWHTYRLDWQKGRVDFLIDEQPVFSTPVSPRGPLGLVIWIDNQYAAFPPTGRLRMGTSPNPAPAWLETGEIDVSPLD